MSSSTLVPSSSASSCLSLFPSSYVSSNTVCHCCSCSSSSSRERRSRYSGRALTCATSRLVSASSPCTLTTAPSTCSCPPSTASISPSSIRYPRTFTCSSSLPRNSKFPSANHLTRSPVRYNLPPRSNGPSTKRSAVCSSRLQYPRPTPAPPMYSSPGAPTGCNPPPAPSTYSRVLSIPFP